MVEELEIDLASELENLIAKWQPRLRLQDWKISAKFVHGTAFDDPTLGDLLVFDLKKRAEIRLLYPEEHDQSMIGEDPWQVVLLHELCHLRLHGIDRNQEDGASEKEEQAVAALSELLWAMEDPTYGL